MYHTHTVVSRKLLSSNNYFKSSIFPPNLQKPPCILSIFYHCQILVAVNCNRVNILVLRCALTFLIMENANSFLHLNLVSATMLIFYVVSVNCQISTPCTVSMLTSFTPCLNFITGSTRNGASSPSTACCDSLKSVMSSSVDCGCLLITGNVPFSLPINRTIAITLPRACNSASVPIQCKGKNFA